MTRSCRLLVRLSRTGRRQNRKRVTLPERVRRRENVPHRPRHLPHLPPWWRDPHRHLPRLVHSGTLDRWSGGRGPYGCPRGWRAGLRDHRVVPPTEADKKVLARFENRLHYRYRKESECPAQRRKPQPAFTATS